MYIYDGLLLFITWKRPLKLKIANLKLKLCYILQYFPTYSFGKFETNLKNVVDDRKDGEGGQNYHPKPEKYVDLLIDDIDW